MSRIQSIIFDKMYWTQGQAESWLQHHGFKNDKIDITENTYRFRQFHPSVNKLPPFPSGRLRKFRYITKTVGQGRKQVRLIVQI